MGAIRREREIVPVREREQNKMNAEVEVKTGMETGVNTIEPEHNEEIARRFEVV